MSEEPDSDRTRDGQISVDAELEAANQIDKLRDEFERDRSSAKQQPIEAYLERIRLDQRDPLLKKLLLSEWDAIDRKGDSRSIDEYVRRFWDHSKLIREIWIDCAGSVKEKQALSNSELWATAAVPANAESKSKQIGPYKLLQQIGEGGMGTVWMAEQVKPVRRRVAIKLIRDDMGSKETIARFEAERQALAMMDHHNIARVFDAGTTESGSPYFVMELVKGIPITQYCDSNRLPISERLELLIPVCKAVQHAHQKGIIHRDLKPSNVLVTLNDGKPEAKVIDFGLAKALEQQMKLTDKTMFTQLGQVVGTVQYMSPEQAEMNDLDVDTRTDVYSLGVMLYELLTGSTPLDKETLGQQGLLNVLELIREKEPPRPSHRLSSFGDAITGISQQRKIAPSKLRQILRGELDWVVMKALEKDRTRRYDTANSLADDMQNYLDGNAVRARPPTAGYQLRKVVQKHKAAFVSGSVFVLLLLAGLIGTGTMWLRAQQEAEKASAAEAQTKLALHDAVVQRVAASEEAEKSRAAELVATIAQQKAEREQARAEREKATAVAVRTFLQTNLLEKANVYNQANAAGGAKKDLTVVEALNIAAIEFSPNTIASKFPDQPDVQAEILETIANTSSSLEQHSLAIRFNDAAIRIRKAAAQEPYPPGLLVAVIDSGFISMKASAYVRAAQIYGQVFANIHNVLDLKPQDFPTASDTGDLELDWEINRRLDAIFDRLVRLGDPRYSISPILSLESELKPFETLQIVSYLLPTIELNIDVHRRLNERFGKDDPRTNYALFMVGLQAHLVAEVKHSGGPAVELMASAIDGGLGSFDQAIGKYEQVLAHFLSALESPDDMRVAMVQIAMAVAYGKRGNDGDDEKALRCFQESHRILNEELGELHPASGANQQALYQHLVKMGRDAEALPLLESLVEHFRSLYGNEDRETMHTIFLLGQARKDLSELETESEEFRDAELLKAIRLFEEALELMVNKYGYEHADTSIVANDLAFAYLDKNDFARAAASFENAWQFRSKNLNRKFDDFIYTLSMLCFSLEQLPDDEKAALFLEKLAERRYDHRKSYQHPLVIADHLRLASAHQRVGDDESVAATLREIDLEAIGDSSFKIWNAVDKPVPLGAELPRLGWIVSNISLDRDGNGEKLEIEFSKDANTVFKLRQQRESEFDDLKVELEPAGFELIRSIPYEIAGDEYVASLWHKETK